MKWIGRKWIFCSDKKKNKKGTWKSISLWIGWNHYNLFDVHIKSHGGKRKRPEISFNKDKVNRCGKKTKKRQFDKITTEPTKVKFLIESLCMCDVQGDFDRIEVNRQTIMDDSIDSERIINDESNADQTVAENVDDNGDDGGQCCNVNNSETSVTDCTLMLRPKDSIHKCQSDPSNRSSMPANNTPRSQIQSRSLRFPSTSATNNPSSATAAATTRKCMFTLDGYNYVIGKRKTYQPKQNQKSQQNQDCIAVCLNC